MVIWICCAGFAFEDVDKLASAPWYLPPFIFNTPLQNRNNQRSQYRATCLQQLGRYISGKGLKILVTISVSTWSSGGALALTSEAVA